MDKIKQLEEKKFKLEAELEITVSKIKELKQKLLEGKE